MTGIVTGGPEIKYDKLSVVALGGQNEHGQVLWILSYGGELLLIDAGAAYPGDDLPGVDLLLPNTNFLEANADRIVALLLTNGHEEHCGAVNYLINHLPIPRIMAPKFVSALVSQGLMQKNSACVIDTVEIKHSYQIGPFEVEWIPVNDAIADACALRIGTPEGQVIYTSSFKLDQTPVDDRKLDVARFAQIGDNNVLLLISDSSGVEHSGYSPSERAVIPKLEHQIASATGRIIVLLAGTNTHRLQILFDLALKLNRKVILYGEALLQSVLVAAITGNLIYDRKIEAGFAELEKLPDKDVLIIASGPDGDPMSMLHDLAFNNVDELKVRSGDTVIYSAEIDLGSSRRMAMILDQFLAFGVKIFWGVRHGVHVWEHASREELKLMLSIVKPKYFVPALGEGRHIIHHAQLAYDCGMSPEAVFPLRNGEILEIGGTSVNILGTIEAQPILYNRNLAEKVTSFSVKERRVLSIEGVVTIAVTVNDSADQVSKPVIAAGASGFLQSTQWQTVREDLISLVSEIVVAHKTSEKRDVAALRSAIRDQCTKALRGKLMAKPVVQVFVHELTTTYPGQ